MPDALWLGVAVTGAAAAAFWTLPPRADQRLLRNDRGPDARRQLSRRVHDLAVRRLRAGPAHRRRQREDRARMIRAVAALAAELESGQPPTRALLRAGGERSCWPAATAAARHGGNVAEALGRDSVHAPVCAQLAACWRVAEQSGAGLAASVARLAASARAAEEARSTLEGQLAVPRATARMLAGLPVIGIAFGMLLGADPLAWLAGATAGRLCLAVGVALVLTGLWWTGRIAATVERQL